jgi:C_GCAxxG_C_C family probable redox protein
MSFPEKAKDNYINGFACAESILHAMRDEGIIENFPEEVLKCSTGFGTGIGGSGGICGAITGSVMAIGLKYGRVDVKEDNKQTFEKINKFLEGFQKRYHKQNCIDLTKTWREKGSFKTPERRKYCSAIVKFAASELEGIL